MQEDDEDEVASVGKARKRCCESYIIDGFDSLADSCVADVCFCERRKGADNTRYTVSKQELKRRFFTNLISISKSHHGKVFMLFLMVDFCGT